MTKIKMRPEDPAIWERAEKIVQEWQTRKDEILSAGTRKVEPIKVDPTEFDTLVFAKYLRVQEFFASRTLKSLRGFKAPAEAAKLDEFGGFMVEELRREATGFFRTEKVGDRWWLFDPLGYPFYLVGVSGMTPNYQKSPAERAAAVEKYGSIEAWAEEGTRELREDLFINTRSVIPDEDKLLREVPRKLCYQHKFNFVGDYERKLGTRNTTKLSGSTLLTDGMHVFDPEFETFCDSVAKETVEKDGYRDDPYFIGYATDNEIPSELAMLDQFLKLDVENKPFSAHSYAVAWTFLKHMTGKDEPTLADLNDSIRDQFRGLVYDRYFSVTATAIRRYDPNHMILGARALNSARWSEWVMRFTGYWCDLITLNWYIDWTPRTNTLEDLARWTDTPFTVTEFFAKAIDCEGELNNPIHDTEPILKTQKERGIFYQNYVLRLLEAKNAVGWFWFQYIDHDPTVGSYGGKRSTNVGIYSNRHNLYRDLADAMAEVNRNVLPLIEYFDKR